MKHHVAEHEPIDWRDLDHRAQEVSRYLDRVSIELDGIRSHATGRLGLTSGNAVLEVGCGTGREAERMARLVGPTGRVGAIDFSQKLIAEAMGRTASLGLPLEFQVADAHALPFADNRFDAARVERTLQHVAQPQIAVRELMRVVRPGGRIAALEPDWETLLLPTDGGDKAPQAIKRYIEEFVARRARIGRDLPQLFVAAGCRDLEVEPVGFGSRDLDFMEILAKLTANLAGAAAQGWISEQEVETWCAAAKARAQSGSFFASLTFILVVAQVP